MSYRLHFEIAGLPKMPNQLLGAHWRTRSKQARLWKHLVWVTIATRRPAVPIKTARVTLTRHSSSEPDDDGLRGSFKSVLDALVHCGVLENDKPSNIGSPAVTWEKAPPKKGRIVVIIEETS